MTSANAGRKPSGRSAGKGSTKPKSSSSAPRTTKKTVTRYPWEQIEEAFINGIENPAKGKELDRTFLNQRELAEHFEVPYQRVRERAAKYRWSERRHAAQVKLSQEKQKARFTKLAGEAAEFDDRSLGVAKVGLAMVQARLAEIAEDLSASKERRKRAKEKLERGEKVDRFELFSAVNYKEMEGLASAADRFQGIGRRSLGTDVERHEFSGPDGGPIEVGGAMSVAEELLRDDPERLASLIAATERAGLLGIVGRVTPDVPEEDANGEPIMDAELVEEEDAEPQHNDDQKENTPNESEGSSPAGASEGTRRRSRLSSM